MEAQAQPSRTPRGIADQTKNEESDRAYQGAAGNRSNESIHGLASHYIKAPAESDPRDQASTLATDNVARYQRPSGWERSKSAGPPPQPPAPRRTLDANAPLRSRSR